MRRTLDDFIQASRMICDRWNTAVHSSCRHFLDVVRQMERYRFGPIDAAINDESLSLQMAPETKAIIVGQLLDTAQALSEVQKYGSKTFQNNGNLMYAISLPCATSLTYCFQNCTALMGCANLDLSKVTNANYMFDQCYSLQSAPHLYNQPTDRKLTTSYMFQNCRLMKDADMSGLYSLSVGYMFYKCMSLRTVKLNPQAVLTSMNVIHCFVGCSALEEVEGLNDILVSHPNIASMTSFISNGRLIDITMAEEMPNLTNLDNAFQFETINYDTARIVFPRRAPKLTTVAGMLKRRGALTDEMVPNLQEMLESAKDSLTTMDGMMQECEGIVSMSLPQTLDNVTSCAYLFSGCKSLESCVMPLSMKSCASFLQSFYHCQSILKVDVPSIPSATSLAKMFDTDSLLQEVTWRDEELAGVTTAERLFYNCRALTYTNTPRFPSCDNAEYMYANCSSIEELNGSLVFPTVTRAGYIFNGCTLLREIIGLKLPNLVYSEYMFSGCVNIKKVVLDLPRYECAKNRQTLTSFNAKVLNNMFDARKQLQEVEFITTCAPIFCNNMFYNCTALTSIKGLSLANLTLDMKADFPKANPDTKTYLTYPTYQMFTGCTSLTSCILSEGIYKTGIDVASCPFDDPTLVNWAGALYDWAGNPYGLVAKDDGDTHSIRFGTKNITRLKNLSQDGVSLYDMIKNKGWTVT